MRGLDRLLQIISSPRYEESYARAKSAYTCLICGRPANGFTDLSSELEYRISALCQVCQKECFSGTSLDSPAMKSPSRGHGLNLATRSFKT